MGPIGHAAVSSAVGIGVGAATGSPEAGALALGFGVLMDVDHLYDIYRWYVKGQSNRVYILLHAWEYSVAGLVVLAAVFFHPLLQVLIVFLGIHLILGLTISIIFQLAHTVEGNAFPRPAAPTGTIENEWAIHEVETTANFAPKNRLATWYLGGLNFQIEHHLFVRICHIHYSAISGIVEKTCKDFGIPYTCYPTLRSALVAHYKFLRLMGSRA